MKMAKNLNATKLIEVIDPQAGTLKETVKERPTVGDLIFEHEGRPMSLREAAEFSMSEFPQLFRSALKPILFGEYAGWPGTHQFWIDEEMVNQEYVTGIANSGIGKLPVRPEGGSYTEIDVALDRSVQIQLQDRGAILPVTWEAIHYDRTGIVRDWLRDMAGAMAFTEEDDAYTVLTTTTNYTLSDTTGDNDVGANTQTLTFSASAMVEALSLLRTMKDRKSGRYLGVMPDTLIVGAGLEMAAKQLLVSSELRGMGDTDAVLTYGTGTSNPFRGSVTQIVVSPFLGEFEWSLMERGKPIKKFVSADLELLEENMSENSSAYFERRSIRYRVSKIYGVGMWKQHFAFFSDSTTAATVT
jgi:hypothetical protein